MVSKMMGQNMLQSCAIGCPDGLAMQRWCSNVVCSGLGTTICLSSYVMGHNIFSSLLEKGRSRQYVALRLYRDKNGRSATLF